MKLFFQGVLCGLVLTLLFFKLRGCNKDNEIMKKSNLVKFGDDIYQVDSLLGKPTRIYADKEGRLVFYYKTPNFIFMSDPVVTFDKNLKVVQVMPSDD